MDDDSHAVVAPPGPKPTREEMWLIDCVDEKGGSAMVLRNCGLAASKPSLLSISQHAEAYGRMAFASLNLGDAAAALKYANQALVVDLFSAAAHNARAGVFWQQGDYQQALASMTSAVELDGNSDAFLHNLGNVHLALGDTRAAQAAFERINVLRPDLGTGSNGIGRALERTAPDRAIKYFTQAMTLEPKNARFVLDRGICQLLAGRLALARADVDAAFAINPQEPRVLYTRGVLRRRTGDIAGGDADIAAAVTLWKDVAIELNRRGVK
jgi:tetratricopeptide (TPR) repeat protein